MRNWLLLVLLALVALGLPIRAQAGDDLKKELETLKKEIEDLRKEKAATRPVGTGMVDKMVDNKYGPNATVTTKQGKLTIGGLLQVWYYQCQNDTLGIYGDRAPLGPVAGTADVTNNGDTNEGKDNDTYAIRRARVNFTMDIHENVMAYIQLDLANSFGSKPAIPNTGIANRYATAVVLDTNGNSFSNPLIDAYINVHGLIPHHDSTIGQFQPQVGLEGPQSSATLDFCERAMISQLTSGRDVGSQLHGTWMDDRIQYWLGCFNTPGNWIDGATTQENRADNNDQKSFLVSALFRPVWKNETWGSLQIGGSAQFNHTGESGRGTDGLGNAVNGTALVDTDNIRYYGFATYAPGGPVKGWWIKGEYAWIRGRAASGDFDPNSLGINVMDTGVDQTRPRAFDVQGWYVSTGYKLSDSIWADDLPCWLKPAEFCFRYDTYGNIQVADRADTPDFDNYRHDVFKTSVYTAGINYYIKGHNAKVQVNYNWVCEPDQSHDGGANPRQLREVRNNNLVVNFQVAW